VRRTRWTAVLAVAAFAAIVLARLPASWVLRNNPAYACASVDGTVWSGSCSGLSVQQFSLGDLAWQLAPLRLLGGALAAHVALENGPLSARADLALTLGGRVTLQNVTADVPLDPALIPRVPRQLRGRLHADLALARIEHGVVIDLKGRLEAHDLTQRTGQVTRIGSYAVSFPGGSGEPLGTLVDLGGPLAVQGTLRLGRDGGYVLEGQVAARPEAAPELVNSLPYLGSPDALGRRPFSFAGRL
jgi:general secretion pathway protein N